jgi:hypothetical protein
MVVDDTKDTPEISNPAGNVTRILASLGTNPDPDALKLTV